jgi:hypothetical protein
MDKRSASERWARRAVGDYCYGQFSCHESAPGVELECSALTLLSVFCAPALELVQGKLRNLHGSRTCQISAFSRFRCARSTILLYLLSNDSSFLPPGCPLPSVGHRHQVSMLQLYSYTFTTSSQQLQFCSRSSSPDDTQFACDNLFTEIICSG